MSTPIPDSYWLIEGKLLAGEYPGHFDEDETREKLRAFLDAGIRSFIDLAETSDPLEPYDGLLREVAAEAGLDVRYRRMSIRDLGIPREGLMPAILAHIESELAEGRPVYFHCWGGIGRTGTVAGCWLVGQGHSCDEAFARIDALRAPTPDGYRRSPETDEQRAFVRNWPGPRA